MGTPFIEIKTLYTFDNTNLSSYISYHITHNTLIVNSFFDFLHTFQPYGG